MEQKKTYITGFDGLRALAVAFVILYHLFVYQFKGGFMGVLIFFVLSGYLVTNSIIREWTTTGRLDLLNFYWRRIRRLYPALVGVLAATLGYIAFFQRSLLVHIRGAVISNLCGVYNWYEIAHHQSYFARFGVQSPFTHLWFMAIQFQFLVIWPFLMVFLFKFLRERRGALFFSLVGLALLSALLMAVLYQPGKDPSRVYYGTDTRIFAVFIGAALAVIWPLNRLKARLDWGRRTAFDLLGFGALVVVVIMCGFCDDERPWLYRGGMLLFCIATAVLIAMVAHPGADMNRALSNRIFTWIGQRSYGIYLYQYPVMVLFEAKVNVATHPVMYALIEIALILVISDVSYHLIEKPIARIKWGQIRSTIREFFKRHSRYGWRRLAVVPMLALLAVGLYGFCSPAPKQPNPANGSQALQQAIQKNQQAVNKHNAALAHGKSGQQVTSASQQTSGPKLPASIRLTSAEQQQAQKMKITAVGDSVLADSSAALQKIFPQMFINAKVGRQVDQAIPVLQDLKKQGKLNGPLLVVEGTNGPFTDDQMKQIMQLAGNRPVYWVNVHVPTRPWQNEVNTKLTASKKKYKNLTIINWYKFSNGHTDWFYADNVHPNPYGLNFFSNFVAKQILKHH